MSTTVQDLTARLERESRGKHIESMEMYALWDFLSSQGLIENWSAFHDFTSCLIVEEKLYVKKRDNMLVQDLSGEHQTPTCYGCGQDVQFKPVEILITCREGNFEDSGKMPYCPHCENEPSNVVCHYG